MNKKPLCPGSPLQMTVEVRADGAIREEVEERVLEDGKRVRVIRKIRSKLVKEEVSPEVALRRTWAKFGDAAMDGPGPNSNSMTLGEPVFLKLSLGKDIDREIANKTQQPSEARTVKCRLCSGPHWTAMCPYKETFAGEEKEASGLADQGSVKEPEPTKPLKYVPPSMRGAAAAATSGTTSVSDRDNPNTIRLSNLNELCTEADVRALCGHFGAVARCYMAKDHETGRCRGYAFVSFHSADDAQKAIDRLKGHPYGNLILHAEWSKSRDA